MNEPTMKEPPTDEKGWEKHEFTINMNVRVAGPEFQPIWIIKVPGGYVRIPWGGGNALGVKSRRLATRFDSPTWAATLAGTVNGAKVVRLTTKAEREARKMSQTGGSIWTYQKAKPEEPKAEAGGAEGSQPITPDEGANVEARERNVPQGHPRGEAPMGTTDSRACAPR